MKIVIDEGSIIPHYPWYLPSYDEFRLNQNLTCVVCYPIGIHLIVRIVRRIFHWYMRNIDNRLRKLTKFDELDFANSRIEHLIDEVNYIQMRLEIELMNRTTKDIQK